MPRYRRNPRGERTTKRGAQKPKYTSRKKYTVSTRKLRDKSLNTLVEKRMAEIAKQQIAKNRVSRVKRNYCFGEYDAALNSFIDGTSQDFNGKVVYLSNIQLLDNVTAINIPPADDPDTMENEALDNDGVNQIAPTQDPNGRRSNDTVLITGVNVDVRGKLERILDAGDIEYKNVRVWWAVVKVVENPYNSAPYVEPSADELLPFRGFGYTHKIDADEEADKVSAKKTTLLKGSMSLRLNESETDVKFWNKYVRFKNPIKIKYALGDQTGANPINTRIYFVIRSTTPAGDHANYKPITHVCTKLYYYEP